MAPLTKRQLREFERQRSVHSWEAAIWPSHMLPREITCLPARAPEDLRVLLSRAWAFGAHRFGLDAEPVPLLRVDVRMGRRQLKSGGKRRAYSGFLFSRSRKERGGPGIVLGSIGVSEPILLHEVAHLLVQSPHHTEKFCRAALDLYCGFLGVDEAEALRTARTFGIAVAGRSK